MATKPPAKKAPAKKGPQRPAVVPKSIEDLKGAKYNPRVITDKQLNHLKQSYAEFGDLSGVVFNRSSGVLVSGHQRIKTLKGKQTRIVKEAVKRDGVGTVAVGFIEVRDGERLIKMPYREVEWSDGKMERAANVSANAAGGEFDQQKLGAILQELQQGEFDIEKTGLNSFDAQKSLIAHRASQRKTEAQAPAKKGAARHSDEEQDEFQEVTAEGAAESLTLCCPRCKFRFEPPAAKRAAPAKKAPLAKKGPPSKKAPAKKGRPL